MDGTPQRLKGSHLINNRKMDRLCGGPTTGGENDTTATAAIQTQQQQGNQKLPSKPTTTNLWPMVTLLLLLHRIEVLYNLWIHSNT